MMYFVLQQKSIKLQKSTTLQKARQYFKPNENNSYSSRAQYLLEINFGIQPIF